MEKKTIQKIAIIGGGVSGLLCAFLLQERYNIVLFEKTTRLGGHAKTGKINIDDNIYNIDEGVVAYGSKNGCPNLYRLLDKFNVAKRKCEYTFSYQSIPLGFAYSTKHLPITNSYHRKIIKNMLYLTFHLSKFKVDQKDFQINLISYLKIFHFDDFFIYNFFVPFLAGLWLLKPEDICTLSTNFVFHYMKKNNAFSFWNYILPPPSYTIVNGTSAWIEALTNHIKCDIRKEINVIKIIRENEKVTINTDQGKFDFDAAIICTPGNELIKIIDHPDIQESEVFSSICYRPVKAILHTDENILCPNKKLWSSINFNDQGNGNGFFTYDMNIIHGIKTKTTVFATFVHDYFPIIDPGKIIIERETSHPYWPTDNEKYIKKYTLINGKNKIYYCGTYWQYGDHESAITTAINTCKLLGIDF